jgi:hypothetical protein
MELMAAKANGSGSSSASVRAVGAIVSSCRDGGPLNRRRPTVDGDGDTFVLGAHRSDELRQARLYLSE